MFGRTGYRKQYGFESKCESKTCGREASTRRNNARKTFPRKHEGWSGVHVVSDADKASDLPQESQEFVEAQTYIMLEIQLEKLLVEKRRPKNLRRELPS